MEEKIFDVVQLDLELTLLCNLNCPYCYLGKKPNSDSMMSQETLDTALEFLEKFGHLHNKGREHATRLNLYGGEPMLNWSAIEYIVNWVKTRKYDVGFVIVSNGTIGTPEQAEFCRKNNVSITRSIDGCPETLELGRGKNHPELLRVFKEQTAIWKDYDKTRRMTCTPDAAKYMLKSLRYMEEELGIKKGGGTAPDFYVQWTEQQTQDLINVVWEIGEEYVNDWKAGKPFQYSWFERELRRYRLPAKINARHFRLGQGCGASAKLMCVSWDGYLFPCHRFSTEMRDGPYCYGKVRDCIDGTAKGYGKEFKERFAWIRAGNIPECCEDCAANISCSGGCPHQNMKVMGDIAYTPPIICKCKREIMHVMDWVDSQLRQIDAAWWTKDAQNRYKESMTKKKMCGLSSSKQFLESNPKSVPKVGRSLVVGYVPIAEQRRFIYSADTIRNKPVVRIAKKAAVTNVAKISEIHVKEIPVVTPIIDKVETGDNTR